MPELPPGSEVVVIDNGSSDEDVAAVTAIVARYPSVSMIRNSANLGFAGGCNVGLDHALRQGADFILLINNDAVVEPGAIATLVEHMDSRPRTGMASPVVLDMSGERVWAAGGVRATREVVCRLGMARCAPSDVPTEPFQPYALIGCAIIIRREVVETVGRLEEAYFAYVEDVDYSLSVRDAGWTIDVVPSARVRHVIAASTGGGYSPLRGYLLARATALFVRRRAALDQRVGFALAAPAGLVVAALREIPRGNGRAVAAKLKGYVDGLLGRPVRAEYF